MPLEKNGHQIQSHNNKSNEKNFEKNERWWQCKKGKKQSTKKEYKNQILKLLQSSQENFYRYKN